MDKADAITYPLVSTSLAVVVWTLVVALFNIPEFLLPTPVAVFAALIANIGLLGAHALATLTSILLGYTCALTIGIPLGVAMASWQSAERSLSPIIVAMQSVPKSAFAPLFVLWFGFGLLPKAIITLLIAFFPIVIATLTGLKAVEEDMLRLGRSMGLAWHRMFLAIMLPAALPTMFAGFRIAMTLSVVGAIVAEFVAADKGLGYLLLVSQAQFNTPLLFATLLVLASLGIFVYTAVTLVEKLSIPWHISTRGDVRGLSA